MQVGVLIQQPRDDVDVHHRVEVLQLFREPQVRPDHRHARVPGQEVVPSFEVHDLLEVVLRLVAGVKEAAVVRAQHVLPPPVLRLRQDQLLRRHEAAWSKRDYLNSEQNTVAKV